MASKFTFLGLECAFLFFLLDTVAPESTSEFCIGEIFEATCKTNEVVVIESALYGRMAIGRCVKRNHGYLGCSNDALEALDTACSGKRSCDVAITTDLRRNVTGACGEVIVGYAQIAYSCKQVMAITREQCQGSDVQLTSPQTLVASSSIKDVCRGSSGHLKITTMPGQTMNVSLWDFAGDMDHSYGVVKDSHSSQSTGLGGTMRFQHILASSGNVIEINLHRLQSQTADFLIEIQVTGCADMSPPDGAWMTRHGDVMEIGCHSGSKSWTLHCENNQWIGVLGYCGQNGAAKTGLARPEPADSEDWSVSLNVLVFGVCSLIILGSACIFLVGVILLKRKMTSGKLTALLPQTKPDMPVGYVINDDERLVSNQFTQNSLRINGRNSTIDRASDYKSLQASRMDRRPHQATLDNEEQACCDHAGLHPAHVQRGAAGKFR